MPNVFRKMPSIAELLDRPALKKLLDSGGDSSVVASVQNFLDQVRGDLQAAAEKAPDVGELAEQIARWISGSGQSGLQRAINATGQLLPSQLGRAPLAIEVLEHVAATTSGYCNLTMGSSPDIRQHAAIEHGLQQITGAESALLVNDHAAATMLALSVAADHQVIVSRGDMSDLSGCDVSTVCEQAQAQAVEVGAVHQCSLEDYRDAIVPETRAMLRVFSSSFQIAGETSAVSVGNLAALARQRHAPLIVSLESGALVDTNRYGLQLPNVPATLAEGADLVTFAGDQLFGGPRCGVVVGRRGLIAGIRKHPLFTMLQVDKMTLAAVDATLRIYQQGGALDERLPILALLSTSTENLRQRAERLATQLQAMDPIHATSVLDSHAWLIANVPAQRVPSCQVLLEPAPGTEPRKLAERLRAQSPALWTQMRHGQVALDMRGVRPDEDEMLLTAVRGLVSES